MMNHIYLQSLDMLGLEPRSHQQSLYTQISESLLVPKTTLLAQASTGVGKTLAAATAAISVVTQEAGKKPLVVIASPTVVLCREYMALFDKLGVHAGLLLSYRNFFCMTRIDALLAQYKVGSSEHELLMTMVNWNGAIDEYLLEYNELPLNLKQVDVCQSPYTVTEDFKKAKEAILSCNILVTTHAMLINDVIQMGRVLRLKERKSFLIVDEADALIDSLQESQQRHFNILREFSLVRDLIPVKQHDNLESIIFELRGRLNRGVTFTQQGKSEALSTLIDLQGVLAKPKRNLTEEELRYFVEFKDYFDQLVADVTVSDQVALSLTKVREEPTVAIYNPYFSRVFGYYLDANKVSSALISGTLSIGSDVMNGTEWVSKELKLEYQNVIKREFTPEHFGDLNLHIYRSSEDMYEYDGDDDNAVNLSEFWLHDMARRISGLSGKTLVVTASFSEAEALGDILGATALVHRSGERLSLVKEAFVNSDDHQYLLSPSAHTGINFTLHNRSVLKNIVITRLGFAPRSEVLQNLSASDAFPLEKIRVLKLREYYSTVNKVIRRSIQILGRGIRHEEDEINLIILDNRFPLYDELGGKFSSLKAIIPTRFSKKYRDADVRKPMGANSENESPESVDLSFIC